MNAAEHLFEPLQCFDALFSARLGMRFRQRADEQSVGGDFHRLGQRLDERQKGFKPVVRQLPREGDEFVEQDHARPRQLQDLDHQLGARVGSGRFRLGDDFQTAIAGEPPGDITPKRVNLGTILHDERHVGPLRGTNEHGHLRPLPAAQPGALEQRPNTFETLWFGGLGQVIDGKHRMRLAAAERCLQTDDRITALAREALQTARQHAPQPFGQERDAEEILRRAIILGRVACIDREEVGGELGLLEAIGQDVGVRQDCVDPGFQPFGQRARLFGCGREIELRRGYGGCRRWPCGDRRENARLPLRIVELLQLRDLVCRGLHRTQQLVHGVEVSDRLVVL